MTISNKSTRKYHIVSKNSFLNKLQDSSVISSEQNKILSEFEIELQNYIYHTNIANEFNQVSEDIKRRMGPLLCFDKNKHIYPRLSEIAKIFFSVPAKSVPSESLLSVAGIIKNDQRNRLNRDV